MTANNGDIKPNGGPDPAMAEPNFNVEADISRLKRSSYIMAVLLIVLLVAFLGFVALSLLGYVAISNTPELPPVIHVVYPITDNIRVYEEASKQSDVIASLKQMDQLYELERIPGMAKIRKGNLIGWVVTEKIKTKTEIVAAFDELKKRIHINLGIVLRWGKKDLLVNGKLTNNSDISIKNLRFTVYFLNAAMDVIHSESKSLFEQQEMVIGEVSEFNMVGSNMLDKVLYVAYEIENVDPVLPPEASPTPSPEDVSNLGGE